MLYFPVVPRRYNDPERPGGLVGVTTSALLGTINMFYVFGFGSADVETFVEISELPVKDRIGSLYIIDEIPLSEARLAGFTRVPSGPTKIIHIDAVAYKIKLTHPLKKIASLPVPDENDEGDETKVADDEGSGTLCAIPMWESR